MARIGITYTDVKTAAYKLLSRGDSPSVQKIREVLGTGSNSTIADHLRAWRDEYAKKEIHHLPGNMPQELVSAIEMLWQTAMEQAERQLATVKQDLETREQQFTQEKSTNQKSMDDLKLQSDSLSEKINTLANANANLKTELSLLHERLTQSNDKLGEKEAQFESQRQRAYEEKTKAIDESQKLKDQIGQLQKDITEQSKNHHSQITSERRQQEESERRWLNLIDQSRQETKNLSKQYKILESKHAREAAQDRETILELKGAIQSLKSDLRLAKSENSLVTSEYEARKLEVLKLQQDVRELNNHIREQQHKKNKLIRKKRTKVESP